MRKLPMSDYIHEGFASPQAAFSLRTGSDILGDWSATATHREREAVYAALFSMVDGSLFHAYEVMDDFQLPSELFVLVPNRLVIKIRINFLGSFSIVRIGYREEFSDLFFTRREGYG
ncbi:hypothetical protein SacmaDRAFT_4558 [Saccharomonospora marina XMU15]|uniref:Uncharacterized protein n=2 Tax=Saccharomonospora TaxID=1851 RepID=H5XBV4_9PSEU|nr:hypothetical protein SacmaDRAFT_4558 [Saccharomonospora marina XMU15]